MLKFLLLNQNNGLKSDLIKPKQKLKLKKNGSEAKAKAKAKKSKALKNHHLDLIMIQVVKEFMVSQLHIRHIVEVVLALRQQE